MLIAGLILKVFPLLLTVTLKVKNCDVLYREGLVLSRR